MAAESSNTAAQWWAGLDRARRLTIVALAIMTLSQFMNYVGPHTEMRSVEMSGVYVPNASSGTMAVGEQVPGQSGWSVHPYAWLILGALLALFVFHLDLGSAWKRWRYWIAVAGMALCLFPFDTENLPGWGFVVGIGAIAIGVWAARGTQRVPAV